MDCTRAGAGLDWRSHHDALTTLDQLLAGMSHGQGAFAMFLPVAYPATACTTARR